MSDFYNKYPYTDFHELNLDWVIERVKKLTEDWAATLEEWNSTEEQWQQLYDYVHDYFDNLDVQQEINNKINTMIADGTFVTITTPVIEAKVASMMPATVASQIGDTVASQIGGTVSNQLPAVVSDQIGAAIVTPVNTWLEQNITQPTTPVVDASLTISGAAADAEVTGERIKQTNAELNGLADSVESEKIKNFINYFDLSKRKYAGYDVYNITGNSIVVNLTDGTPEADVPTYFTLNAGTYTISVENSTRMQVIANHVKIVDVTGTNYTFTLTGESDIFIKLIGGSYPHTVGYVQLERGSSVTAFTPSDKPVYVSGLKTEQQNIIHALQQTDIKSLTVSEPAANQGTINSGVLRYDGQIVATGYRSELSVSENDFIYFDGYCYNQSFPCIFLMNDSTIVTSYYKTTGSYYGNVIIPPGVNKIVVNSSTNPVVAIITSYDLSVPVMQYINTTAADIGNNLKGKTIVWYGTSIPAGGYIGLNITRNYPTYIANKYGCTVYNEAVGSSCAHCKELNIISAENPYGFNPNFDLSSRCLANTQTEMQWIIDNYTASFWTDAPATLPATTQQEILSFSYENRIDKYLTPGTFPDLFVFDHGYNDYISSTDWYTGHEFEPYTFQGAMNFFIRRILSYNPAAKIVIIGNYKWQTRDGKVVEAQHDIAKRWDIPVFDTWHHTGLSEEQAYCDFTWVKVGGVWTQQPAASHLDEVSDILMPDGVHPHSRPDDLLINRMANSIGTWLNDNIPNDN